MHGVHAHARAHAHLRLGRVAAHAQPVADAHRTLELLTWPVGEVAREEAHLHARACMHMHVSCTCKCRTREMHRLGTRTCTRAGARAPPASPCMRTHLRDRPLEKECGRVVASQTKPVERRLADALAARLLDAVHPHLDMPCTCAHARTHARTREGRHVHVCARAWRECTCHMRVAHVRVVHMPRARARTSDDAPSKMAVYTCHAFVARVRPRSRWDGPGGDAPAPWAVMQTCAAARECP